MEYRFKQIIILFFIILIYASCDQFEMRGFIAAYESADQRFDQSMEWNADHPSQQIEVSEDDYNFFVMGDSHVGGTTNLDFFVQEAIKSKATAVVMVGDITMGYAENFETIQQHLPEKELMPSFLIPGNHDLYFDGWKKYYSLFGSSTYWFTVNTPKATDLFVCLDSASGTLGSKQIEWLKELLKSERFDYRHCIMFTHNNFFRLRHTFSGNPYVEELQALLELCAKYQVDMIISGHDHSRNEVVFGNTTFITMDLLKDDSKNAGYLKLFIKNGEIEYEFVNL